MQIEEGFELKSFSCYVDYKLNIERKKLIGKVPKLENRTIFLVTNLEEEVETFKSNA